MLVTNWSTLKKVIKKLFKKEKKLFKGVKKPLKTNSGLVKVYKN